MTTFFRKIFCFKMYFHLDFISCEVLKIKLANTLQNISGLILSNCERDIWVDIFNLQEVPTQVSNWEILFWSLTLGLFSLTLVSFLTFFLPSFSHVASKCWISFSFYLFIFFSISCHKQCLLSFQDQLITIFVLLLWLIHLCIRYLFAWLFKIFSFPFTIIFYILLCLFDHINLNIANMMHIKQYLFSFHMKEKKNVWIVTFIKMLSFHSQMLIFL